MSSNRFFNLLQFLNNTSLFDKINSRNLVKKYESLFILTSIACLLLSTHDNMVTPCSVKNKKANTLNRFLSASVSPAPCLPGHKILPWSFSNIKSLRKTVSSFLRTVSFNLFVEKHHKALPNPGQSLPFLFLI
jgi:hypothetical protein